jgi:uncharacterized protein DUF4411
MKKYCLDTSGLSNPLEFMPEDIHPAMWAKVAALVTGGTFATTVEIYEELKHLPGPIGECIKDNDAVLQMEIEEPDWDWHTYLSHYEEMKARHAAVISEYNGNRKGTIGLNDLTIIALAKTLGLPVISSEKKTNIGQESDKRQKIPDICIKEGVVHLDFNDLLRAEGIRN